MHKHLANSWSHIYREDSLQLRIVNALEKKKERKKTPHHHHHIVFPETKP